MQLTDKDDALHVFTPPTEISYTHTKDNDRLRKELNLPEDKKLLLHV